MSDYYLLKAGETEPSGPWRTSELAAKMDEGEVTLEDFVCRPGEEQWRQVRERFSRQPAAGTAAAAVDPLPEASPADVICSTCGTIGRPRKLVPGSFLAEVALWGVSVLVVVLFLPAGVVMLLLSLGYSLARVFGRRGRVCPGCGSSVLIPSTSPEGRKRVRPVNWLGHPV